MLWFWLSRSLYWIFISSFHSRRVNNTTKAVKFIDFFFCIHPHSNTSQTKQCSMWPVIGFTLRHITRKLVEVLGLRSLCKSSEFYMHVQLIERDTKYLQWARNLFMLKIEKNKKWETERINASTLFLYSTLLFFISGGGDGILHFNFDIDTKEQPIR